MTLKIEEIDDLEIKIYKRVSQEYAEAIHTHDRKEYSDALINSINQDLKNGYLEIYQKLNDLEISDNHWHIFNKTMNEHPLLKNEWKKFMTLMRMLKE